MRRVGNSGHAGNGAAATNTGDDRVEPVFHLLPNLRCGPVFVRLRIGEIGKLVDAKRTLASRLHFRCNAFGHVLVILGMPFGNIRTRHHDLDTHRAQMKNFLLAHLVRNHQQQLVTLVDRG